VGAVLEILAAKGGAGLVRAAGFDAAAAPRAGDAGEARASAFLLYTAFFDKLGGR